MYEGSADALILKSISEKGSGSWGDANDNDDVGCDERIGIIVLESWSCIVITSGLSDSNDQVENETK